MEMLFDIMDIPKIVEDEDIVGWFGSIASANGWDGRSFMSAFFPENIACRNGIFSAVRDYRGIYERYGRFGFPDPGKMLMSHSPVPVSGLFMPDFYIGMLADMTLNGTDMLPFESARYRAPMYCPLCLKEDLAKEGRAVVHIPHQVPGVTACYKHCVRLSKDPDARPERAEEQEFRTAKAVQMLYRKQAVGSFEDIAGPLRKRAEERGKLSLLNRSDSFPFYKNALSLSASLFTDREILRAYDKDDGWAIKRGVLIFLWSAVCWLHILTH